MAEENLESPHVAHPEAAELIIQELYHRDDRISAIIGAAIVDEALWEALSPMITNPESARRLMQGSRRNEFAYALGMYGKKTKNDIDTIHGIRNALAHSLYETVEGAAVPLKFEHLDPTKYQWKLLPTLRRDMPSTLGRQFKAAVESIWLSLALIRPELTWIRIKGPLP